MRRILIKFGLVFVLFLISIEIIGQLIFADPLAITDLLVPAEPPLYFRGRPNAEIDYKGVLARLDSTKIKLNTLGFRDIEPEINDRRPKINIYGDSNTFGLGVPAEAIFPYHLQARLPDYQVNNYAVPGYNFGQMFHLYNKMTQDNAFSIFVIFNNDFSPVIGLHKKPPFFALARHSFLFQIYFIVRNVIMIEDDQQKAKQEYNQSLEFLNLLATNGKMIWFVILSRPMFEINQFEQIINENFFLIDCESIYKKNKLKKDEHINANGHLLIADRLQEELTTKNILQKKGHSEKQ